MTIRLLAWMAVAAVVVHATATGLLHWLVPGVDPLSEMVGAYLSSDYQWLSRITFVALACALGSIGLGLSLCRVKGAVFTVAIVMAAIAVVGCLGVASAPAAAAAFARPTQPATISAVLLLSLVLRREPEWSTVGPMLLGLSLGLIVLFVATIVHGSLVSAGFGGLANRVVLVQIYAWILLVARGLLAASDVKAAA